ncbi:MAG: hypothetical protein V5A43_06425 [Haloarculaceae archaeon]
MTNDLQHFGDRDPEEDEGIILVAGPATAPSSKALTSLSNGNWTSTATSLKALTSLARR